MSSLLWCLRVVSLSLLVVSGTVFASTSERAHRASLEAFRLALLVDQAEEEGSVLLPATQAGVDAAAREARASLFDETLPLSARLTALAAVTRLGAATTFPALGATDLPRLRNPELQGMARASLDAVESRRRALESLRRH